jgi:hypothetical protein
LFRCGFLLALRQPAKLSEDALHTTAGGVVTAIEIACV